VIAVYADEMAAFDVPEVEILQRFADDLAYGIVALRTRERQEEAEAQLREMLRSKDKFVATIAHELRTPLTAVVGFAQVLQDEGSGLSANDRAEMMRAVTTGPSIQAASRSAGSTPANDSSVFVLNDGVREANAAPADQPAFPATYPTQLSSPKRPTAIPLFHTSHS